jgi:AraC family transcriptional regulator
MNVPETTSAENLARYIGSKILATGKGNAWRDIQAWILLNPPSVKAFTHPAVSEPYIAWTISGEVDFQEREGGRPWSTHRIKKGSFFLTTGGPPYECRWKAVTPEPFESMMVILGVPLLDRAMAEVFGPKAPAARLRDLSGFTDPALESWTGLLRDELGRRKASALFVQGIAQAIAVHLARNYAEVTGGPRSASPSLPGYKLKQVLDWMAEHLADGFSLDDLAAMAGLSKFYFDRLFKSATGVSPSRYHTTLRVEEAKRLLRENGTSVIDVAIEVGYATPSHFAQVFRRETGLSPSDYRRQR